MCDNNWKHKSAWWNVEENTIKQISIVFLVNETPKRCYDLCRRKLEVTIIILESKAMTNYTFV